MSASSFCDMITWPLSSSELLSDLEHLVGVGGEFQLVQMVVLVLVGGIEMLLGVCCELRLVEVLANHINPHEMYGLEPDSVTQELYVIGVLTSSGACRPLQ